MPLQDKITHSLELIKKSEKLALKYQDFGFHLAFSGGKDSMVIHELCVMAKVKFKSFMSITTLDPPELMRFIRNNYPDTVFLRPEINFYKLIVKKKMLPTRVARYCCMYLKEQAGTNSVVITGVRKAESIKRAKRNELEISNHKYSNTLDQFNMDFETKALCVSGKDKIILNPIIDWSDKDVWDFIKLKKLKYCSLYNEGYERIGCIFCPMSKPSTKQLDRKRYPKIEKTIKKSIQTLVDKEGFGDLFDYDVNDIFNWWISNQGIKYHLLKKRQHTIF